MTTTIARHASKKTSNPISINPQLCLFGNHMNSDFDQTTNYGLLYAEENSVIEGICHFGYSTRISKEDSTSTVCTEATGNSEKRLYTFNQAPSRHSGATSRNSVADKSFKYYNSSQLADTTKDQFRKLEVTEQFLSLMEFTNKSYERQITDSVLSIPDEDSDEKCDDERIEKVINVTPSQSPVESHEKDEVTKMMKFCLENRDSLCTPLIHSRSSSLGSLSDHDQQSTHESSYTISDLSHDASRLVSSCKLTDSTALFTPSNISCERDESFMRKETLQKQPTLESHIPQEGLSEDGFFNDAFAVFKEQSTPIEFQSFAASSLSSLTIDDNENLNKHNNRDSRRRNVETDGTRPVLMPNQLNTISQLQIVDGCGTASKRENNSYTDEEEILDEYVRKGIAKVTKQKVNELDSRIDDDSHDLKTSNLENSNENAGSSHSETCLLDENSDLTAEEEKLLDECIRRGIAKVTRQSINDITPVSLRKNLSTVNLNKSETSE